MPTISSLFIYPIKSCAGIALDHMRFDARGPMFDRRYMLIDANGKFITQRDNPLLARIQPELTGERLTVRAPEMKDLTLKPSRARRVRVTVWSFEGEALDIGDTAAEWFSEVIEQTCRVVTFADNVTRPTSRKHTDRESQVAFADGYPVLLVSAESLSELNRRLVKPVPMNRFRPNVVVRDCQPFAEDRWRRAFTRDLTLHVTKPCVRCKITTIDQRTLSKSKEPLATLATFRRTPDGVIFGQNCIHEGRGLLRVGDEIQVA